MKPVIAVTIGDFNGIGPEVSLKAALHPAVRRVCLPLLVGPLNIFEHECRRLRIKTAIGKASLPLLSHSGLMVFDVGDGIFADVHYGKVSKSAGKNTGTAIERAVDLCMRKKVDAMVTAPASKEALQLAQFHFPGQTEMVALLSRSAHVAMMLVSNKLRVGLVTIHTSLRSVADQITKEKIVEKISVVHDALVRDFRIPRPRIAVLALNPHAGEHGLMGTEDDQIVGPAVEQARSRFPQTEGPFPSDAFFGNAGHKKFDAVVAMYHDQGLIPLKMASFGKAVNYSAGLNIVRTSPDHGTAYDIAGKNKASMTSMVEAMKLAVLISKNRGEGD